MGVELSMLFLLCGPRLTSPSAHSSLFPPPLLLLMIAIDPHDSFIYVERALRKKEKTKRGEKRTSDPNYGNGGSIQDGIIVNRLRGAVRFGAVWFHRIWLVTIAGVSMILCLRSELKFESAGSDFRGFFTESVLKVGLLHEMLMNQLYMTFFITDIRKIREETKPNRRENGANGP